MPLSVWDAPDQVLNCHYRDLPALHLHWQGYLPLVHPLSLRVITVVRVSCPNEPDPWVRADVKDGHLVHVGHPCAKDVAVLKRALPMANNVSNKQPLP